MAVIHYGHICLASPKADQPLSEDRGNGQWELGSEWGSCAGARVTPVFYVCNASVQIMH